jgi:hypothetical protein
MLDYIKELKMLDYSSSIHYKIEFILLFIINKEIMRYSCEYCNIKNMVWFDFNRHLQTQKHTINHRKFTMEDIKQLEKNRKNNFNSNTSK